MQAEEAGLEFVVLRELVFHQAVDPGGVVLLVAVTVGLIVHNLAGMDLLMVVNLPEDDTTVLGGSQAVAGCCTVQLSFGQIARGNHGLTKF